LDFNQLFLVDWVYDLLPDSALLPFISKKILRNEESNLEEMYFAIQVNESWHWTTSLLPSKQVSVHGFNSSQGVSVESFDKSLQVHPGSSALASLLSLLQLPQKSMVLSMVVHPSP
jgi:hypothetical protein